MEAQVLTGWEADSNIAGCTGSRGASQVLDGREYWNV
jgi:hypothetical protein